MTKKQPSKKAIQSIRIIIAAFALVVAIVIFLFIRSIVDKRILLDNGEQVTGTVQAHGVDVTTSRGGSLTKREITYSFTPRGSNEKVTKEDFSVSRKEYEKYPTESQIQITYLPSNPSMSQPSVSLRHMPPIAVDFLYLSLVIIVAILGSKIVKNFQSKHNIKSPDWPFYVTSFAGFIGAFVIAGVLIVFISYLMGVILS